MKARINSNVGADWDRRIATNYRYWMSDGVETDDDMWETGQRDFNSLFLKVSDGAIQNTTALEVGCGVGRLIRTAADHFSSVVGVDVSEHAITRAKEYFAEYPNVSFSLCDGERFSSISDNSIGVAYSFAVLGHVPAAVFASYLAETNRVLQFGGRFLLQVYTGSEQENVVEDTISIRCYDPLRLRSTCEHAGFGIERLYELTMPYDARDVDKGIYPHILHLRKEKEPSRTRDELVHTLLSLQESEASSTWPGSLLEYQLAVTRANECIECGKLEEAVVMLELAISRYKTPDAGTIRVYEAIKRARSEAK